MYNAIVSGLGTYVPEKRLTNFDLEKMVETNDEWILTRTGISERRIAAPEQATSDLAFHAAKSALEHAGVSASDIDMIIVATVTPDHPFPPVACQLQHRLGCRNITAFDVEATCVGFLTAVQIAEQFVKTGRHRHVLVIGAETLSRITDYTDRGTCILFADGAGAFVVSRGEVLADGTTIADQRQGILYAAQHAAGEHLERLYQPGGGSRMPASTEEGRQNAKIVMEGNKIFKLAVNAMSTTVKETLEATGLTPDDIDWLIPHQANQRIIDMVAEQLHFPNEKVISTIRNFGNNSSATIPIAMEIAIQEGKIKRGDTVMLTAFGGGLIWGSLLFKY